MQRRCAIAALFAQLATAAAQIPTPTPTQTPGPSPAPARQQPAQSPAKSPVIPPSDDPASAIPRTDPTLDPNVNRPAGAHRVVQRFDFEEFDANPTPVPRFWLRAQDDPDHPRPGFPNWNRAHLDYQVACAGKGSVRFPTAGGSTSLLLEPGVIPVFEATDYGISIRVKTAGLSLARPTLVARFLGRDAKPLANTEVRRSVAPGDDWREIFVEMIGGNPDAAFLQIELQLLQPEQAATAKTPEFNAWPQDFEGSAWFDELIVTQLPRVELSAKGPANTLAAPDKPRLLGVVRDLTGEDMTMRIELRDWRGRVVDQMSQRIGAGRGSIDWSPTIDQPGWYRAKLDVIGASRTVGGTAVSFVYLPKPATPVSRADRDPTFSPDRARFTLTFQDWPASARALIPELIARTGSAAGTLPVWPADLTIANAQETARALGAAADPMVERWQTPTLAITRLPDELATKLRLDPVDVWALLTRDPAEWTGYIEPSLERFGQRVQRWQIGQTGDGTSTTLPDLQARLDRTAGVIGRLVPGPVLIVPIRADRELPTAIIPALDPIRTGVVASVYPEAPEDVIETFAKQWKETFPKNAPDLTLAFHVPPSDAAGPDQVSTMVKRVVHFWRLFDDTGSHTRLSLVHAWDWVGLRRPQPVPRAELAAWRNLADRLADRRVVGELPIAPGVHCYILGPTAKAPAGRTGALVAWTDAGPIPSRTLRAYLGEGPITLIDTVGAVTPAAADDTQTTPGVQRPVVVPITTDPVFVEGVDSSLVRFLASVRVDPPFIICSNEQHEHAIVFDNPWPVQLEGRLTIVSPGSTASGGARDRTWTFTPRSAPFNIPAGQTARIPITVAFSSAAEAGTEEMVIDFDLAASRSYGTVRGVAHIELGLQNLRMEVRAVRQAAPHEDDLSIEATVTNTGTEAVTLSLTSFAPGFPRAKASINELAAGADVIRKFHYPGGYTKLLGQRVVVGINDPEAKTHLNKSVPVE